MAVKLDKYSSYMLYLVDGLLCLNVFSMILAAISAICIVMIIITFLAITILNQRSRDWFSHND